MCVYIYTCKYVYMFVCMYIYIYTYIHTCAVQIHLYVDIPLLKWEAHPSSHASNLLRKAEVILLVGRVPHALNVVNTPSNTKIHHPQRK